MSSTTTSSFQITTKTVAYGVAFLAGVYLIKKLRENSKLPPGPVGLPLLGIYPKLTEENVIETFYKIVRQHNGLASFSVGTNFIVIVDDYEMLKEMFAMPVFLGRPRNPFISKITQDCGIIFTEGEVWANQRRQSLHFLRDFGFAKSISTDLILEEVKRLEERLEEFVDVKEGVNLVNAFSDATNSVIASMTFGHRFSRSDADFQKACDVMKVIIGDDILLSPQFSFPQLGNLVWLISMIPRVKKITKRVLWLQDYILSNINSRKEIMGKDTEPTCLCDSYILAQRKAEIAGDFETYKDFQLIRVCLELFLAGTDTTSRSLEWLMIYMAAYPEIQSRVYEEIVEVIGTDRRPQMSDKMSMHYTQAVLDETSRKATLAPMSVFHRATEDTVYRGYTIPKTATLIPFIYGVHHNPKYFKDPEKYMPERFLDKLGHYDSSPYLMPFFIGKRSCPGESLARMEIFLFFTSLIQRFEFRFNESCSDKVESILQGVFATVFVAGDYRLNIFNRE